MAAIRLQRYLAQAGVAARRKAEVLITDGKVKVNGKVVTELGSKVDPARDKVEVDGVLVERDDLFYLVLNKPKACVTTVSDPHDRPTVMDYVFGVPDSVVPVGRLDFYSEGVLLMTNDGALAAALLAPNRHVEKTYHVKVRGRVRRDHLEAMRSGVRLDDGRMTRPARVDLLKTSSNHDWLVITLTEGRSRQIHRMAEALGYTVLKLQRVAFAGITYEGLRVGDARELTQAEVTALYQQVGLQRPARATARGTWRVTREQTESARRLRGLAREGKTTRTAKSRTSREMPGKRSRPARPERKRSGRSEARDQRQDKGRGGRGKRKRR